MYRKKQEPVSTEIIAGKKYTPSQLDMIAEQLLRNDAKSELCRDCGGRGATTGESQTVAQETCDEEGNKLTLSFPEYQCEDGHSWFQGEGAVRGIGGENPVLFEEHFQSRKRREIYTTIGTPDPNIVSGMYNRCHPRGRKVNSPEQRKKNGASFFR